MNWQRVADIATVVKAAGAVIALILISIIAVAVVAYVKAVITLQMLVDIGPLATAIGAVIAVIIALYVYYKDKKWNTYRYLADLYYEILRRGLEHPEFRNPENTREYKKTWPSGSKSERYLQYDAYAGMCWTHAFDIHDTKELKKDFIGLYLPTIDGYNRLHGVWLLDHTSTFSFNFIDFVLSYKWREYLGRYAARWVRWENVVDGFDGKILNPSLKTDGKRLFDCIKDDDDIKEYLKKKQEEEEEVIVADIGCGNEKVIESLSKIEKVKIEKVYSIDYSDNMLEMAKKRTNLPNVTYEKIDMTKLSEIYGEIDIAFSINSILPRNPNATPIILDEIYKTLNPGGLFIAILPSFDTVLFLKELWYKCRIEDLKELYKHRIKNFGKKWVAKLETLLFNKYCKLNVRYLFNIDAKFENVLNNGIISKELKEKFKTKKFPISENAMVRTEKDDKWEIADGEKIYGVKKEDGKLNIYNVRHLDTDDFLNVHRFIYDKDKGILPLFRKAGFILTHVEKVTYPPCELCEEYDYDYFSEEDFWDWLVVAKKPGNGE